jgi:hypothetical protein
VSDGAAGSTAEVLLSGRTTHRVKSWPENFAAVVAGRKTFEIRRDDRSPPYQCGDLIRLQEWAPPDRPDVREPGYTGASILMLIGLVSRGPCCPENWCAFELIPVETALRVGAAILARPQR